MTGPEQPPQNGFDLGKQQAVVDHITGGCEHVGIKTVHIQADMDRTVPQAEQSVVKDRVQAITADTIGCVKVNALLTDDGVFRGVDARAPRMQVLEPFRLTFCRPI